MSDYRFAIDKQTGTVGSYASPTLGPQAYTQPENTEIERRLIELDARNEDLRSILSGFQVKLQSVLVPQMKNEVQGAGQPTPRPVLSPMADRLDKILDESRHTAFLLRDMFDRIAL